MNVLGNDDLVGFAGRTFKNLGVVRDIISDVIRDIIKQVFATPSLRFFDTENILVREIILQRLNRFTKLLPHDAEGIPPTFGMLRRVRSEPTRSRG
ncbi:MAG: hypothetical protein ABGZ53_30395, partial [Fuerstiella sp.]